MNMLVLKCGFSTFSVLIEWLDLITQKHIWHSGSGLESQQTPRRHTTKVSMLDANRRVMTLLETNGA